MKKEVQEEFIQNLWNNHWVKNDYELKNKLKPFLDRLSIKLAKPEDFFRNKLSDILEELESIKKEYQIGKEAKQKKIWNIHGSNINEVIDSMSKILKHEQEEEKISIEETRSKISELEEIESEKMIENLEISHTAIDLENNQNQDYDQIMILQESPTK